METMKIRILHPFLSLFLLTLFLAACGGTPIKSKCSVEIFIPSPEYTEIILLDTQGNVIDSTLSLKNDSIRFFREDIDMMPYIATVMLSNPSDSLDIIYHPIVVEGGTVRLELTDRISLTGTADNDRLFRFLKDKNRYLSHYENKEQDVEKLRADHSRFFTDQIMRNKDNIVGEYILATYREFLEPDDLTTSREALREAGGGE